MADVIAFISIESLEVQIYQNEDQPEYRGHPCMVADSTGKIVSVSREAKALGISHCIKADQAKEICADLKVITKPTRWNKPDTQTLRHGRWIVLDALKSFIGQNNGVILQHVSSDCFFLNITKEVKCRIEKHGMNTIIVGQNVNLEQGNPPSANRAFTEGEVGQDVYRLLHGSLILSEVMDTLTVETNVECSVGISSNKLLAKLACHLSKLLQITVLPFEDFEVVLEQRDMDLGELPGFGGYNSEWIKHVLGFNGLRKLRQTQPNKLAHLFGGRIAKKLHDGSHGICHEKVFLTTVSNNITCCKTFRAMERKMFDDDIKAHLQDLGGEMNERLLEEQSRHSCTAETLQLQVIYTNVVGRQVKRNTSFPISAEWYEIPYLAMDSFRSLRIDLRQVRINKITLQAAWKQNNATNPQLSSVEQVYQIKISLNDTDPEIRRTIQVPANFTFLELHHAIQDAMGWAESSFHEFELGYEIKDTSGQNSVLCVGKPNGVCAKIKYNNPQLDENITPIKMFLSHVGDELIYQHGSITVQSESNAIGEWPHTITLQEIMPATSGKSYPCCIAGERACPPEFNMDSYGFDDLLAKLIHPTEARKMHEKGLYVGFEPTRFNLDDVFFSEAEDLLDGVE